MLFRTRHDRQPPVSPDAGLVTDGAGRAGRYLTDGVDLYRFLGEMAGSMGRLIGLENCRSLDVTLLPIGELRALRLRTVKPVGTE